MASHHAGAPVRGSSPARAPDRPRPVRTLPYLAGKPVDVLAGVGERKADAFRALGIESVCDLLQHLPRRHHDRSRQVPVRDLAVGDDAFVIGVVDAVDVVRSRKGPSRVVVTVTDGSAHLLCTFFNQPWRARQLDSGAEVALYGKVSSYRGRRQMANPTLDLIGRAGRRRTGSIIALYPASEKVRLSSSEIADAISEALDRSGTFADPLPERWRVELGLVDRTTAYWRIHQPRSLSERDAALRRLAFDRLWHLQCLLVAKRRQMEQSALGIVHAVDPGVLDSDASRAAGIAVVDSPTVSLLGSFLERLPFGLTGAQRRAVGEILSDMAGPLPMHRLLQGDVGSGKTVVAAFALVAAVQGGHQGALMAPTEVLAEQHHGALLGLLGDLVVPDPGRLGGERDLKVALLTGRLAARERQSVLAGLAAREVDVVVGTHALLTEDVAFSSLGVVVVDEQHRFGVEQRSALRSKGTGSDPDVLVMTATPIPRTAAMTVFGDLDTTVLDEMPPGRRMPETHWARSVAEVASAWGRVRSEVAMGKRAYVVCPLVEGSEKLQARAVTEEYERLCGEELAGLHVGLMHGQLKGGEKDEVMDAFRSGAISVLVATTVIEVGVDVPEATVMVIEDADRFGLAQLHQLRGRVGRAGGESWCYLLAEDVSPDGEARLRALERLDDGFELAEVDLELRGEGTILGTRQTGRYGLAPARLGRDRDLLFAARKVAEDLVGSDPSLGEHPVLAAELRELMGEEAEFLFKS